MTQAMGAAKAATKAARAAVAAALHPARLLTVKVNSGLSFYID